jgi:hypothetical protein
MREKRVRPCRQLGRCLGLRGSVCGRFLTTNDQPNASEGTIGVTELNALSQSRKVAQRNARLSSCFILHHLGKLVAAALTAMISIHGKMFA